MTAATSDAGLLRSSRTMAIGTILSRVTGLVRTLVLAAVLGTGSLGDAYNVANNVPNIVYELLLGGVLTSVLVPLLVRAGRDSEADGELYACRLLSAVIGVLAVATLLAVAFAPQLMQLLLSHPKGDQLRIGTAFARFFLPQIFFYGVGAMIGAILNTRGSFAAPMWAPVLNNLVVIATLFAFMATTNGPRLTTLTNNQVLLLGAGTTAGIVLQTIALLPALRRVGFPLRLTVNVRGVGLREAARLGGWTLVYVVANQAAFTVVLKLSTLLTKTQPGFGFTVYINAFLVFSLPHAIVAVSVISALLPQMSRHATDGRLAEVARDLARGTRLSCVVLMPASLLLIALHAPLGQLLFGHGRSVADAGAIGTAVAVFALGIVPFSAFQLQLRAFYSFADTRTPALINIAINAVNIVADLVLYAILPANERVYGLAGGFALSYWVGWVITTRVLSARLGRLGTAATLRTLVRLFVAGGVGAAVAFGLAQLAAHTLGQGTLACLAAVLAGSAAAAVVVVVLADRMRVTEVRDLVAVVTHRSG
ncbi:MAG: putative peptidoglycan lipid flippase [Frankiaceae bacterium]|nr:putative peptidoglycan lipid flippase [Frankiaceae bacterium]